MKITCGCKVISCNGIEYCPKHKAAPEMYEALKAITEQFKRLDYLYSRDQEVITTADKALLKAEGKGEA